MHAPPAISRHSSPRTTMHLYSTRPHLPRHTAHTPAMLPPCSSHRATTQPLSTRPRLLRYATHTPPTLPHLISSHLLAPHGHARLATLHRQLQRHHASCTPG
ncbi:hypothetical protein Pcinc_007763 [Petrolisthes cinctipes]|uniref:Uncharacterized protein n=1 Tax=Petrolisthes cinctipes TaxID=88211 RepID=A0AAE1GA81_PETCI|nr:hypothetical protein Pcinc_007763 [Petrolisthes cinctipes]